MSFHHQIRIHFMGEFLAQNVCRFPKMGRSESKYVKEPRKFAANGKQIKSYEHIGAAIYLEAGALGFKKKIATGISRTYQFTAFATVIGFWQSSSCK